MSAIPLERADGVEIEEVREGVLPPPPIAGDIWVPRIVVGALGGVLVAVVLAAGLIAANKGAAGIPAELWTLGNTVIGALLGLVIPSQPAPPPPAGPASPGGLHGLVNELLRQAIHMLVANKTFLSLLALFSVTGVASLFTSSVQVQSVASAAGGALLGLLMPSPILHGSRAGAAPAATRPPTLEP